MLILILATLATWIVGLTSQATWSAWAIGGCWLVFGGYILYRLLTSGNRELAMAPIALVIIICIGVSLPPAVFDAIFDPVNDLLEQLGSPLPAGKIGHILCFAALTLFAFKVRHKLEIRAIEVAVFLVLLAVATEGMQLFIKGRTTKLLDMGFDLFGALIGFGLFGIYKLWINPKSKTQVEEA